MQAKSKKRSTLPGAEQVGRLSQGVSNREPGNGVWSPPQASMHSEVSVMPDTALQQVVGHSSAPYFTHREPPPQVAGDQHHQISPGSRWQTVCLTVFRSS